MFRFVAQQNRCGHNWLPENKLSVLSDSPEGRVLCSEWLIQLKRCKFEQCKQIQTQFWRRAILQGRWSEQYFLKKVGQACKVLA